MSGLDDLFAAAARARAQAYAPYSRFAVGAAIRGAGGGVYLGCNVENAAYPSGACAEQSAIGAMVLAGERRIAEIAVIGAGAEPVTPCGACRQRILEFGEVGTLIHAGSTEGARRSFTLADLLPESFGPGHLRRIAP